MIRAALFLALALCAGQASAQCRLALALAFDISSSVSATEDRLQRHGIANALIQPDVAATILGVPGQPVALAVFEWSGRHQQDMVLESTLLDSPRALRAAAALIRDSRRSYADFPTAVGPMLRAAQSLFDRAPPCLFQTLDVSGDGIHNEGPEPLEVYAEGTLAGVTVNGLTILGARMSQNFDRGLEAFYRRRVLKGPGAFLEIANGFGDFHDAMARKLIRETGTQIFGGLQ